MEEIKVTQERKIDEKLLKSVFEMLELRAVGGAKFPSQGETTINVLQETDKGLLLIRFNPVLKSKLETGHAMFEIESLYFFGKNGIPVPTLLKFRDKLYFETDKWIICSYICLPGVPICRSELSVELAVKLGEFLLNVIRISVNYSSYEEPFINAFNYIIEIAAKVEKRFPKLKESELWNMLKRAMKTNRNILKDTPTGIVHADFFYENILKDQNDNIIGLIDFGDAYYGHILHDAAIGAMECCVLEDEKWNLEIFSAFLKTISPFLIKYSITFCQFYETLKVDCFRFAIYTLSSTLACESSIECNIYIKRYKKLMLKHFEEEIHEIYTKICC